MKSFNKKISLLLVAVMFSTFMPTKVTALADFNSIKQTAKNRKRKQKF